MTSLNRFARTCFAIAIGQAMVTSGQTATITVNTTVDVDAGVPSPCTLREAIASINNSSIAGTGCAYSELFGVNDIVNFDPGLNGQTIVLSQSTAIPISTDLTINGLGQNLLAISGNANAGVLSINNSIVEINHVTITGGSTANIGGGIYATDSVISLTNSSISGNSAYAGGGVYAIQSSVNLINTSIVGNLAASSGGGLRFGMSDINLSNCVLTDNTASYGGGINAGNSTMTLNETTISNNYATTKGGGIRGVFSSVTLNNSTIAGNSAPEGGGISVRLETSVDLNNTIIKGNSASANGGGIEIGLNLLPESEFGSSSVNLNNSTLSGNWASSNGGGLFALGEISPNNAVVNLTNSTLSFNTAGSDGGGASTNDTTVNLINVTVAQNEANRGGGLFLGTNNTVSLINNIFSGNSASSAGDLMKQFNGGSIFSTQLHNIIGDNSKNNSESFLFLTPGPTDITTTINGTLPTPLAAIISPLTANGGRTKTHALPLGSPAINAGEQGFCPPKDQRDESRNDDKCDIGAYEFVAENCFVVNTVNGKAVVFCL